MDKLSRWNVASRAVWISSSSQKINSYSKNYFPKKFCLRNWGQILNLAATAILGIAKMTDGWGSNITTVKQKIQVWSQWHETVTTF